MRLVLPFVSVIIAFFALATTALAADRLDHLAALSGTDYTRVQSRTLDRPFHIYVRKPSDYDETDKDYPVVYLLDGDITFPIIAAYHYLLQYDEKAIPEAIIVGISYGTFDPEAGNYRSADYSTPPLPEDFRNGVDDGDVHGGAAAFQQFLKYEIINHVEENYRADPARRILLGQSRGAHFALYSAYTDPDLFWGRIVSNPSFKPNKDLFFADETLPDINNAKLYFSSAENDWPALKADADAWAARWQNDTPPWDLEFVEPQGETHAAGLVAVYRSGMRWLFGGAN